ncbi:biopolymer transporter ExbD [Shimia sp. SDUM112013]|uniref:ExbD/TolR family protein n=1 Tax=Shimia sp. SDUM112013 TaxID=3136160 RepID=UPI0032EFA6D7
MLSLSSPRQRKRPSLTPMIDVVFLLLVFFMLASQFGMDRVLPLAAGGGSGEYSGPPRLVTLTPDRILLNGRAVELDELVAEVSTLTRDKVDAIVLKPDDKVSLQRLMDVATALNAAGFFNVVVLE